MPSLNNTLPKAQPVGWVFIKVLSYIHEILSGGLRELKNNEKVQLGNSKGDRGRLRERSLTRALN